MQSETVLEEGTLEALRIGLEAMRAKRDELDLKIRACERTLKAPTMKTQPTVAATGHYSLPKKKSYGTKRPALSYKNVRASLFADNGRSLFCCGKVARALLNGNGEPMTVKEVSARIGHATNMVCYALRHSPNGLFHLEKDGKALRLSLTQTGAEMAKQALLERSQAGKLEPLAV